MRSATFHSAAGEWPDHEATGTVTLGFDARHRRRLVLTTDAGEEVLLNLPNAVAMADRDGLRLDDGSWLQVIAAKQPLVEVRHADIHQLARLAWHLGNRHLPVEIRDHALFIRPDHVIEAMLRGFGATLRPVTEPFQPEGGAYAGHGHSHHDHG